MFKAMKDFMAGVFSLAIGWQIWLMVLMGVNLVWPLAYYNHVEAQWTIAAFFAGAMTGMALVKLQGFTRLLGVMHIYWIPLIAFLIFRMDQLPADAWFVIWVKALIILNTISLAIDTVEVIRYLKGERQPLYRPETGEAS